MLKMTKGQFIFDNLGKKIDNTDLTLIANEIQSDIIDQTQSGRDVDNKAFNAYTPKYAQKKQKDFGTSTVNLTRTQQMLNAITFKSITNGIRFYFNASEQNTKAYHNQVTYKRKFFGLSDKNIKKVKAFIKKQIS